MERDLSGVQVECSTIHGVGVVAARAFSPGEVVLALDDSRVVDEAHPLRPDYGEEPHHCDYLARGRVVLQPWPERHINSSCDPSTVVRTGPEGVRRVVALRAIAPGEEVTYDYLINCHGGIVWQCTCGSPRCRGTVPGSYFDLPLAEQHRLRALLDAWFVHEHRQRLAAPEKPATSGGHPPHSPENGMSDEQRWTTVDRYLGATLLPADPVLDAALAANAAAGLPPIDVSPLLGKLLHLLARAVSARAVLEIGTLGGYSTIWLARAVAPSGRVVTLEVDEERAAVAQGNLQRAGLADAVEIRVGRALDTLPRLAADSTAPFDFIFIDADKPSMPQYIEWALRLSRPGTLIVCDNVVRGGAVADPGSTDASAIGARSSLEVLAADPRVSVTAIQTVGSKGHDGFALALVTAV
jgi:predicted O-methyltransferase YrrM